MSFSNSMDNVLGCIQDKMKSTNRRLGDGSGGLQSSGRASPSLVVPVDRYRTDILKNCTIGYVFITRLVRGNRSFVRSM